LAGTAATEAEKAGLEGKRPTLPQRPKADVEMRQLTLRQLAVLVVTGTPSAMVATEEMAD
jgi:hypothetical protein